MPIDKRIRCMPLPKIHPTNREIDLSWKEWIEEGKKINQRQYQHMLNRITSLCR